MKTIRRVNLKGKRAILRVDFNVPMEKTKILDDSRIKEALPTIQYLIEKGASVVIISHLGRPEGKRVSALSLKPAAKRLEKLLGKKVEFLSETTGLKAREKAAKLKPGQVLILENLRFTPYEELGDTEFAKKLAKMGNIFVQEAFSCAHRPHASMLAITKFLPSYAGLHFEKECTKASKILREPKKPFVFITGGKKIGTKIEILKSIIERADIVLLGGGIANTFLVAEGHEVGKSFYEEDYVSDAETVIRDAYDKGVEILFPCDVVTAKNVSDTARTEEKDVQQIEASDIIVDIGPKTVSKYAQPIKFAGTIFWNGPVGIAECKKFSNGTKALANMITGNERVSVVGGGDTVAVLGDLRVMDSFTHVSTAGGAMMEFIAGAKMPVIEALR
ncbi:MAG: phosphoglycerate kinase [Candidatus Schekmanbacteria bacterium RBG_16_38_10]|uniref:Phosphoglycerate kinase n=1 Tax=Candidatus Schekmanbacteria bacterium RBG_16_38_10 TaxID=1817879 RepID=A0A1F7RQ69_9BACT|nr:MAG: phosphoglycerate kinase [Candidatus Schekmanbacteria bacterium RBG_16_38_10]